MLSWFAYCVQAAENYRAHSTNATLQRSSATQEVEKLRAEYQQLQRERDQVVLQTACYTFVWAVVLSVVCACTFLQAKVMIIIKIYSTSSSSTVELSTSNYKEKKDQVVGVHIQTHVPAYTHTHRQTHTNTHTNTHTHTLTDNVLLCFAIRCSA